MDGTLRSAMIAAVEAIEGSRELLCELDSQTGDGDHGVTMTIGARGVRRQLEALDSDDAVRIVRAAATGMAGAGGAIGPIYGRALLAVAAELETAGLGEPGSAEGIAPGSHGGAPGPASGPGDVVRLLARSAAAAEAAVVALGRAAPGDKTVLDALDPLAASLAASAASGVSPEAALEAARDAARSGAQATVAMVATVGRASRFGERSRGSADPGATSLAIVVDALVGSALGRATGSRPEVGA